ncbi:hypothetical protein H9X86_06690 [Pseudoflavonifractor capillosus]|uniref:hypothetical protein n=1 Tax=Pseudoflavonifractor capillosus TaxID=106588 RepID=UPI001958097C|nr:hypothetical protein [Pseudoflavonifractor capillosus]MBM6897056.1 hypothetical protein [Pseudoflavonifractor capillosus]
MARKPKKYEDDDGRVIADMSGISRPGLILPGDTASKPQTQPQQPEERQEDLRPWEDSGMSREDRRAYVWAALKSALLIGIIYVVVFGLIIALMLWFWK